VCPGRHFALQSAWIVIASVLATCNIMKPHSDDSNDKIDLVEDFADGLVMWVDLSSLNINIFWYTPIGTQNHSNAVSLHDPLSLWSWWQLAIQLWKITKEFFKASGLDKSRYLWRKTLCWANCQGSIKYYFLQYQTCITSNTSVNPKKLFISVMDLMWSSSLS